MTAPLLFGDCHTHLDQYDEAELSGILERAAEGGGDVGAAGGDHAGVDS